MTMTSMKLSADEAKASMSIDTKPGDGPRYPYGLCLYMNTETLKKLGITELPKVGSKLTIVAQVDVTSVGMRQQQDGDEEMNADLQITDMEIKGAQRSQAELASLLYTGKE